MRPAGENDFVLSEHNHVVVSCFIMPFKKKNKGGKKGPSFLSEFLVHFPAAAVPVGAPRSQMVLY